MKLYPFLLLGTGLLSAAGVAAQERTQQVTLEVTNPWSADQTDEPVVLRLDALQLPSGIRSAVVKAGNDEIPSQLDDLDGDRRPDELAFVADFAAGATRSFTITLSTAKPTTVYPARVYAEMLLAGKNGKHQPVQSVTVPGNANIYNLMHHHGPAFESELVAYRLYFDHKQTVDIYGKFRKGFELQESQFYPTDEQLARGFGDDVLRVSGSCGVGALKGWNGQKALHIEPIATQTERIVAYGPVRTIADIEVTGWQYQGTELNMTNRYILYAGHRDVRVETTFDAPLSDQTFCTGVQDIKGSVSYSDHQGLIACWGRDWPVNDTVKYAKETVGLACYIPQRYVKEEVKDKPNYLYTLGAAGQTSLVHYISFTSRKETFGYPTPEAWFAHVRQWKQTLEQPLTITLKQSK
jgi:hypothetical protein